MIPACRKPEFIGIFKNAGNSLKLDKAIPVIFKGTWSPDGLSYG
jgi:hypothetical protein